MDKAAFLDFVVGVVRRIDPEPGFKVLPRRWVVERTFSWMTRWRRLVRDFEQRLDVSAAMIHVAIGSLLLRRISHLVLSQTDSYMTIEFREIDRSFLKASREWFEDDTFRRMIDAVKVDEAVQRAWFDSLPGRCDYRIWGVTSNGQWIGSTGLKHIDLDKREAEYWGFIYPIEYRERGHGRRMFARCTDYARYMGLDRIYLRVLIDNKQAISAYTRWGLRPTFETDKVFLHMESRL